MHKVCLEPIGKELEVNHNTPLRDIVAELGLEFPCGGNGFCGNCKVRIMAGDIEVSEQHARMLQKKGLSSQWRLACYSHVTEDVTLYIDQCECIVQTDQTLFPVQPEDGYGIAVDLGSTTIVTQLINLYNGHIVAVSTSLNPQSAYGADIISRISYALSSEEHLQQLCQLVRHAIKKLILEMVGDHYYDIRKVVISGNSVMYSLFCALDVSTLAVYPFQSRQNDMQEFTPQDLDWPLPSGCHICFLPNIGHFVGSDILSGIEAIQMHTKKKFQALIDLGTNGEIAIGNREKILCASTAAGPAFEGIHISQGMRASAGAIYQIDEHNNCPKIIGNGKAIGICGSGLVDAMYLFLKQRKIDTSGAITRGVPFLAVAGKIGITDKDIREFQLAKAAICTGIEILTKELNISIDDIEHLYIAGGLGNYLDIDKAIAIGLLEIKDKVKVIKVNNSALLGTRMFLFQNTIHDRTTILNIAQHCSLESHVNFQDIYCEKLFFLDLSE